MQQTLNTSVLFLQPNTVHRGDDSNEFHSQNKASQACYQYLEFPLLFLPPVSQWILVCIYFSVSLEISQTFSFWIPEGKVGSSSENRLLISSNAVRRFGPDLYCTGPGAAKGCMRTE